MRRTIQSANASAATACCLLLSFAASAAANAITIVNPGFETVQTSPFDTTPFSIPDGDFIDTLGTQGLVFPGGAVYSGQGSIGAAFVPGWQVNGGIFGVGVFNPTGLGVLSGWSGNYVAYANGYVAKPTSFYQTLSDTAQAGTYVLSVDVGERTDSRYVTPVDPLIRLDGAGTASSSITPAPVFGGFAKYSVTYVVAPGDPNIGQALGITLGNQNLTINQNASQVEFDNVSLDFTPDVAAAPLPSAGYGALALLGLLGAARLRSKVRHR